MIVSHKWLQRFFDETLPATEDIVKKLTFGVFEIENTRKIKHPISNVEDVVFDVKVLPDRACYALSHRGIAREVATLCNLPIEDPLRGPLSSLEPRTDKITIFVEDTARCPFYAVALIRGVKVGPSPGWLRERLEAIGQKSINNIVDATNFVMFDLGTPLHAFDADKFSGKIGVRAARDGEKITLLGGQEKVLTKEMTVITDEKADVPMAIAGVKGGAHAEISFGTNDIVIEAAKFDPARTRKTAMALNLKTDASKRFENDIAVELPLYGIKAVVNLILAIAGGELVGYATTELPRKISYKLGISSKETNKLLGTQLNDEDLEAIFKKLGFEYEYVDNPSSKIIEIARAQLGKPYKLGASVLRDAPHAFDCSGLVLYSHLMVGVSMPRISIDQYLWGEPIEKPALQPGDLAFFNTQRDGVKAWTEAVEYMRGKSVAEGISHVALYAGAGMCVHARETSGMVVEEKLDDLESRAVLVGYRRVATTEPRFVITVPFERNDLRVPQDMIEEIGRVYGYENIEAKELPFAIEAPEQNSHWIIAERVRGALSKLDFTEVYTYTLRNDGEVKLANALASDKSTLRSSLAHGVIEALDKNEHNAPLLGIDVVKIFEIGNVFTKEGEHFHACIGVRLPTTKKRADKTNTLLLEAKMAIEKELGVKVVRGTRDISEETFEFDLGSIITEDIQCPLLPFIEGGVQYKPLSPYPFVLRDIALWISKETSVEEVKKVIREQGGETLFRMDQFDEFSKEGRTSYAFHLVFQSKEKTLSNDDTNIIMNNIQMAMRKRNWEVR